MDQYQALLRRRNQNWDCVSPRTGDCFLVDLSLNHSTNWEVKVRGFDFNMSMRFRYSKVAVCGAGFALSSYMLPVGLRQDDLTRWENMQAATDISLGLWQDENEGMYFFDGQPQNPKVRLQIAHTDWHILEISYSGNRYQVYFDQDLIYERRSPSYPTFFWIRNPVDLGSGFDCPWVSIAIDYVRIQRTP